MIPIRQQLINQQEMDTELTNLQHALHLIFTLNTKNLSYQKTYHTVYRLCKQGLHQELITQITKSISTHFRNTIHNLPIHPNKVSSSITNSITILIQTIQRVLETLLYLQTNQPTPLINMFNSLLLQALLSRKELIEALISEIINCKIQADIQNAIFTIHMINKIDEHQLFVVQHFLPAYLNSMSTYYQVTSQQHLYSLDHYLHWAMSMLDDERQFLMDISIDRQNSKIPIESFLKNIYDVIVTAHKPQIYHQYSKQLFTHHTPSILQLFNKVSTEDVKMHTDWYINMVRNQLSQLQRVHNNQLLESFIRFYWTVGDYLNETVKKFNISYKVKFVFEEWLNEQKINIAHRFNLYIYSYMLEYFKEKENTDFTKFLAYCQVIFKLLKKKDEFEREYRKMIIRRNIQNIYNQQLENQLIQIMIKECGKEWVHKINNLTASVANHTYTHNKSNYVMLFEEVSWPFSKENFNALIAPQLIHLTADFQKKFIDADKKKKIKWHPILGTVKMVFNHNNIIVDTGMATIMLYLKKKKGSTSIGQFIKDNYWIQDQLRQSLKKLVKSQILISSNTLIEFNDNFLKGHPHSKDYIDYTIQESHDAIECLQMEELRADRKMMVEAMIVKLMKAMKVSTKKDILSKVSPVIESRGFKFNKQFVENSIQRLLEKEFIRDFNDGTYGYIA